MNAKPTGFVYRLGSTSVHCCVTALVKAPIVTVWQLLAEPSRWDDRVVSVHTLDGRKLQQGSKYEVHVKILPWGGPSRSVEEVVACEPPRLLAIRGTQTWGTYFVIKNTLEERPSGTNLRYEAETTLFGPMRLLSKLTAWISQRALDDSIARLQRYVEDQLPRQT